MIGMENGLTIVFNNSRENSSWRLLWIGFSKLADGFNFSENTYFKYVLLN